MNLKYATNSRPQALELYAVGVLLTCFLSRGLYCTESQTKYSRYVRMYIILLNRQICHIYRDIPTVFSLRQNTV
jgi:hypothetical protein